MELNNITIKADKYGTFQLVKNVQNSEEILYEDDSHVWKANYNKDEGKWYLDNDTADAIKSIREFLFKYKNTTFNEVSVTFASPYNWVDEPRLYQADDCVRRLYKFFNIEMPNKWKIKGYKQNLTPKKLGEYVPTKYRLTYVLTYTNDKGTEFTWKFPIIFNEILIDDTPEVIRNVVLPKEVREYFNRNKQKSTSTALKKSVFLIQK